MAAPPNNASPADITHFEGMIGSCPIRADLPEPELHWCHEQNYRTASHELLLRTATVVDAAIDLHRISLHADIPSRSAMIDAARMMDVVQQQVCDLLSMHLSKAHYDDANKEERQR